MPAIWVKFHPALVPLLDPPRISGWIQTLFQGAQSIKHLIESLGVPHTEIGCVQIGGLPSSLAGLAQDGARVEVFPVNPQDLPPETARFILDNHLGRLASYLRLLGLDTLYRNDFQDEELARLAQEENRILLTRDKRLLMRSAVTNGAWLCSLQPREQLLEINRRYGLARLASPFQRCPRCNHLLQPVDRSEVLDRLEPLTKRYYSEFHICGVCGQIYWKGSHYERIVQLIQALADSPRD
jgi:uncharacterized protein